VEIILSRIYKKDMKDLDFLEYLFLLENSHDTEKITQEYYMRNEN